MALFLADTFDTYTAASTSTEFITVGPWSGTNNNNQISSGLTRFGTGKSLIPNSNTTTSANFASNSASTVYVAFAAYCQPSFSGYTDYYSLSFSGGSGLVISWKSNGDIVVSRSGTTIATFAAAYAALRWHHWQIEVVFSTTVGSIKIRKDGDPSDTFSATGLNTTASGATYMNGVSIFGIVNGGGVAYDDFLVLDNSGSSFNTWPGDVRGYVLQPTAAGSATDFTPTGAATNWEAVDEAASDGDTSYNASSTLNAHDLFAMANLPSTPASILGVVHRLVAKKSDAGTLNLQCEIKSGTTTVQGTSTPLSTSYGLVTYNWGLDPDTGSAWTASAVNALEAGYKISAV